MGDEEITHSATPTCPCCETKWMRALVNKCPGETCDNSYVHLDKPTRVELSTDLDYVEEAWGVCACDMCYRPYLYEWRRARGPFLLLVGTADERISGAVRDLIDCSS
jgi:hypothetical protein